MRALRLNFARRSNSFRPLGAVLLVFFIVSATYLGQSYVALSSDLETWEAKWRSLQKAQHKAADPDPGQKAGWEQLQAELKAANRVIVRLAMPWDDLFREVDASINDQVTLLSVEPDAEKREVRIIAEAKNLSSMLDYVRHLRTITLFKDAYVVSHQNQEQDPQKPVRFVLNAQWMDLSKYSENIQDKSSSLPN
jgi:Tfp pilus assembly protein PilN